MKTINLRSTTKTQAESLTKFLQKFKLTLVILLSVITFISCADDDDGEDCIDEIRTENVSSVDAPETAQLDEPVNIEVQFTVSNACGEFNRFIETGSETSRNIAVEAIYEGCACAEVIETRTVNYPFEASAPGEYELNFRSSETETISVTISVEESSQE